MIRGTCFHYVNSFDELYYVEIPSESIDFDLNKLVRAVICVSVCKSCYDEYNNLGVILDEEKKKQWFGGEIDFKNIFT